MSQPILCPWDHFTTPEDTGIPNLPTPEGAELGQHLATFLEREIESRRLNPALCVDCAFRRGSVPNQCAGTLMTALKCLLEQTSVFDCHHGEGRVCDGFLILATAHEEASQ